MPRRGIELRAGRFFHICNRGVGRRPIFYEPENYLYVIRLLRTKAEKHRVGILAYCLMPNHFHLLARSGQDEGLGRYISGVCGSYAQALNARRSRSGALFQGRCQAVPVDWDEYLAHLSRYIHLNPVEAGLVARPGDWPYSNYAHVSMDGVLIGGIIGNPASYRHFVESPQVLELPGSLKLPGS